MDVLQFTSPSHPCLFIMMWATKGIVENVKSHHHWLNAAIMAMIWHRERILQDSWVTHDRIEPPAPSSSSPLTHTKTWTNCPLRYTEHNLHQHHFRIIAADLTSPTWGPPPPPSSTPGRLLFYNLLYFLFIFRAAAVAVWMSRIRVLQPCKHRINRWDLHMQWIFALSYKTASGNVPLCSHLFKPRLTAWKAIKKIVL